MGSAHHSLREHPIMFASGEVVQIPQRTTRTKKKEYLTRYPSFLVAEVGFDGLCPSFASALRTPDYVRLRRGGSNPTKSNKNKKRKDTLKGIHLFWLRRWDLNHTTSGL